MPLWPRSSSCCAACTTPHARFDPTGLHWADTLADPAGGTLVCHNDVELSNVVFRDGVAVALLDFEFAAPGRPTYDLTQICRVCVPIEDDLDQARLGWHPTDRHGCASSPTPTASTGTGGRSSSSRWRMPSTASKLSPAASPTADVVRAEVVTILDGHSGATPHHINELRRGGCHRPILACRELLEAAPMCRSPVVPIAQIARSWRFGSLEPVGGPHGSRAGRCGRSPSRRHRVRTATSQAR